MLIRRLLLLMMITSALMSSRCMAGAHGLLYQPTLPGSKAAHNREHSVWSVEPSLLNANVKANNASAEVDARPDMRITGKLEKQEIYRKGSSRTLYRIRYEIIDGNIHSSEEPVASGEKQIANEFHNRLAVSLSENNVAVIVEEQDSGKLILSRATNGSDEYSVPGTLRSVKTSPNKEIDSLSESSDFGWVVISDDSADEDYLPESSKGKSKKKTGDPKRKVVSRSQKGKVSKPVRKKPTVKTLEKMKPDLLRFFASNSSRSQRKSQASLEKTEELTCEMNQVCPVPDPTYRVSDHATAEEIMAEATTTMGMLEEWFEVTTVPDELAAEGMEASDWTMLMAFYQMVQGDALEEVSVQDFFDWLKTKLEYNELRREKGHDTRTDAYIDLCLQYTALVFNKKPKRLHKNKAYYLTYDGALLQLQKFVESNPESGWGDFIVELPDVFMELQELHQSHAAIDSAGAFHYKLSTALKEGKRMSADNFFNELQ